MVDTVFGDGSEIGDEHFFVTSSNHVPGCVVDFDPADFEILEDRAHLRNVIEREHELAFQCREPRRHCFEVSGNKIVAIQLQAEIRRVEIEQRLRTVIAFEHLFVWQVLKLHPREPFVRIPDDLGEALRIESRRLLHAALVVQVADKSRIAVLQEIQVARRALDVGEHRGIRSLERIMPLAAHEHEAEIAKQLLVVLLADAEEVHHLAVEVVQDFDLGRFFAEKHLGPPGERFHVCCVLRKERDDLIGKPVLAADVG